TNPGTTNPQISGEVSIIDDKVISINGDNIKKINVNGKTFDLSSPNSSTNFSKTSVDGIETHASGTHIKYAKYGFIIDGYDAVDYLFYQGEKTPIANIPNSGTANYIGQSLYICGDCDDEAIQGTSKFSVDFGKKTLSGSISNTQASDIALNATIFGNTFTGTNDAGTKTHGAFFGDKAQEVSGIFNNDKQDFAGAFGASKQ
ncbi:Slam-dependent surface lipoprotein, partial [Moraxella oblonga]|uniref:Slam-dependent surface lipoprotein n=1 Tax=Moraxella oblonga TaxID=200413 RepID=UPI00082F9B33